MLKIIFVPHKIKATWPPQSGGSRSWAWTTSELLTVLKQTAIDSLVLRIQLSHHLFMLWFRSPFCWNRTSVGQDVHLLTRPFSTSPKQQQQMEFPDDPCKQSWRGADNKRVIMSNQPDSMCVPYCVCVCMSASLCKATQGPKG